MARAAEPKEVFVGREVELAHLRSILTRSTREEGRCVLLNGEAGIGKTRLAAEFARGAGSTGARVLEGRAYQESGAPPYWPWAQALRPYIESARPRELETDLGGSRSLVAALLPALGNRHPVSAPSAPPGGPSEQRFHAYDALATFLLRISARRPLVILLDDLHWADQGTLDFLVFLARGLGRDRLMVLGAYRDTELRDGHRLQTALEQLELEPRFERYEVRGLDVASVDRYLRPHIGETRSRAAAGQVYAVTHGNPLYVSHLARSLAGAPSADARTVLDRLPAGLVDAVRGHLRSLSAETSRFVEAAAVLGTCFSLAEVAAVLGANEATLLAQVEDAVAAQVIRTGGDGDGRYEFTHPLVREALVQHVGLAEAAALHARAVEVIASAAATDGGTRSAELVTHCVHAGSRVPRATLARFCLQAARQAARAFSLDQTLEHSRRGLEAISQQPDAALRAGLIACEGQAMLELVGYAAGTDRLIEAFEYFDRAGNAAAACEVASFLSRVDLRGLDVCRRALAMLPEGSLEAARLVRVRGAILTLNSLDASGGLEDLRLAATSARVHGDRSLEMVCLADQSLVLWVHGRADEAHAAARELLGLARQTGDRLHEMFAHRMLSEVLMRMGGWPEATEHCRAALEIAWDGSTPAAQDMLVYAAWMAVHDASWDRVRELTDRLISPSGEARPGACTAYAPRAAAEYFTGASEAGSRYLDALLERCPVGETDGWTQVLSAHGIMIAVRCGGQTGRLPLAVSYARSVLSSHAHPGVVHHAHVSLGLAATLTGDRAGAAEHYAHLRAGGEWVEREFVDELGTIARGAGRLDEAIEILTTSRVRSSYNRSRCAWAGYELAEAYLQRGHKGDRDTGLALLAETRDTATALGMPPLATKCAARLAELAPEPRDTVAGLTARELDVLRFLAAGKTNKEIAFELAISERTVDRHVSNILPKIAATNRTEAATYALRRGLT
jgi:DNA-binding CsgD family transcriptional regulator/tetratricopeptide (TPR) repeat protein